MFPGPNAQVYYNEAGEPLGWDYPSEYDPNEWDDMNEQRWFDDEWLNDLDDSED